MKTVKQQTGTTGEAYARQWLMQKGYIIRETNWRHGRAEIDIIAAKEGKLIFIEVRSRKNYAFGFPEETISSRKKKLYSLAANEYIHQHQHSGEIRYDVIALRIQKGMVTEALHLEDAFWFIDEE